MDLPRLPLTENLGLFLTLARAGDELVALHLLECPKLEKPISGKGEADTTSEL